MRRHEAGRSKCCRGTSPLSHPRGHGEKQEAAEGHALCYPVVEHQAADASRLLSFCEQAPCAVQQSAGGEAGEGRWGGSAAATAAGVHSSFRSHARQSYTCRWHAPTKLRAFQGSPEHCVDQPEMSIGRLEHDYGASQPLARDACLLNCAREFCLALKWQCCRGSRSVTLTKRSPATDRHPPDRCSHTSFTEASPQSYWQA